jgi:hypothetical protein
MDDAIIAQTQKAVPEPETSETEKAHLETLRSDKSQATIANFLAKRSAAAEDEETTEE